MRKIVILITLMVLFTISTGCALNRKDKPNSSPSLSSINTEAETWQNAYTAFLKDLPVLPDKSTYSFALRNLDNEETPELLIIQQDENALNAVLTVYAYNGNVHKIGDYSNQKESFVGGFRFSNKLEFPGLFECWWGGGVEHYGYLSVKEKQLVFEDLWRMNLTSDTPQKTEISGNKELINESINVFPSDDNTDNLLEMHLVNNENIDKIIQKQP